MTVQAGKEKEGKEREGNGEAMGRFRRLFLI
jgi:hypothetical protein